MKYRQMYNVEMAVCTDRGSDGCTQRNRWVYTEEQMGLYRGTDGCTQRTDGCTQRTSECTLRNRWVHTENRWVYIEEQMGVYSGTDGCTHTGIDGYTHRY